MTSNVAYPGLTAARSSNDLHDVAPTADVLAAGVIPWRSRGGNLEVLLIHRSEYDDWSWPKGKLDDDETLPSCAARETQEEIGLTVRLGIPLPATRYQLKSGANKEVWYWAAEINKQSPTPDGEEVDRTEWLSPHQARRRLTQQSDVEPLAVLENAYRGHTLRTTAFIVLRHAKAKPRSTWSRAEGERPLAATGRRQALAVRELLQAWRPGKVASSPWRRCMETVAPYVQQAKKSIKEVSALTEKQASKHPNKARRELAGLLDKVRYQLVCMHRPVLPLAVAELRQRCPQPGKKNAVPNQILRALPEEDPYLRPGGVVVAHQAVNSCGTIVAIEVYDAFDG